MNEINTSLAELITRSGHEFSSFCELALLMLGAFTVFASCGYLLKFTIKNLLRSVNIWLRGWPPPHVDANGKFKPEYEE